MTPPNPPVSPSQRIAQGLAERDDDVLTRPLDQRRRHQNESRVAAAHVGAPGGDAMEVLAERLRTGEVAQSQISPSQRVALGLYQRALEAKQLLDDDEVMTRRFP